MPGKPDVLNQSFILGASDGLQNPATLEQMLHIAPGKPAHLEKLEVGQAEDVELAFDFLPKTIGGLVGADPFLPGNYHPRRFANQPRSRAMLTGATQIVPCGREIIDTLVDGPGYKLGIISRILTQTHTTKGQSRHIQSGFAKRAIPHGLIFANQGFSIRLRFQVHVIFPKIDMMKEQDQRIKRLQNGLLG